MEETRKTNKKKLVVAFALLALIVVASVITTVVLVLAAGTQNVQTNVNITYTVTDISAVVSGKYGRAGATKLTDMTTDASAPGTDNLTYTFVPEQAEAQAPLQLRKDVSGSDDPNPNPYPNGLITLESGKPYAIFEYKIVNIAYRDKAIQISLNYTDSGNDDTNIVVGYFTADNSLEEFVLNGVTRTDGNWDALIETREGEEEVPHTIRDLSDPGDDLPKTFVNTLYFYVIVSVDDFSQRATFSGTFNFTLTSVELPTPVEP